MKRKFFTVLSCFLIAMLYSCEKENEIILTGSDYIIFGHYYNMCMGDCIAFFKLGKNELYKDKRTQYPPLYNTDGFYTGDFDQMTQNQFENVKDLMDYFPSDLLKESKSVIGCPDCADAGGLYVEYNVNGVRKHWRIDKVRSGVPEKYHTFISKVEDKIALLQK